MKLLTCLYNTPYRPEKVLGLSRLSSLEFLKFQNPDLREDQILSKMKERGRDPEEILAEHQLQIACEEKLATVLKKLDISFRITKSIGEAMKCVDWADLVVPIGGDGTFLLASKLIKDNTKPVFGINPAFTTKTNMFMLPSKYTSNIESIFERLHSGEYTVLVRSMQKKIADALKPRERTLPWLALNEVFVGEFLASRPITLRIKVGDQEEHTIRSSGICVCTGSGSRSWYKSMNVQSAETVQNIVELAMGKRLNPQEANELLHKYYQGLLFPPEDLRMTYMIREMYRTTRCTKVKCYPGREMCDKITVKSGGFDAGLIIDGSISLPFNDGTTASFDIQPEYALRNIVLT